MIASSSSRELIKEAFEHIANAGMISVMVLGDFMLDRNIRGVCHRISPESPVPVVHVQSETDCLGGAGNVVANLYGLGVKALPVGVLGCDKTADRVRAHLREIGCPSDLLIEVPGRPTVEKTRVIAQNQQIVRIDREEIEPLREHTYISLIKAAGVALEAADICVISDYGKGVCQPALLRNVMNLAQQHSVPVLVDPKSLDFSRYVGALCITPNLLETSRVVHLESNDDVAVGNAARELQETYNFENVLITRGADGMTLLTQNEVLHIAAEAREVYDVSGAGDTVIATMAVALGSGLSFENAARLANASAGIIVGKLGTVPISFSELQRVVHTNGLRRTHAKVMSIRELLYRLSVWRHEGKKIVFTDGCFDLLRVGHVTFLEEAADLGNVMIVGLNSDASMGFLKGTNRLINNEHHRALVLAGLGAIDAVVVFDENKSMELLKVIRPDVLVKGVDYHKEDVVGSSFVKSYGGMVIDLSVLDVLS